MTQSPAQEAVPRPQNPDEFVGQGLTLTPLDQLPVAEPDLAARLRAEQEGIGPVVILRDADKPNGGETQARRPQEQNGHVGMAQVGGLTRKAGAHAPRDAAGRAMYADVDPASLPIDVRDRIIKELEKRTPGRHAAARPSAGRPEEGHTKGDAEAQRPTTSENPDGPNGAGRAIAARRRAAEKLAAMRVSGHESTEQTSEQPIAHDTSGSVPARDSSLAAGIKGRRKADEESRNGMHSPVRSLAELRDSHPSVKGKTFLLNRRDDKVYSNELQTKEYFGLSDSTLVGLIRGPKRQDTNSAHAGIFYSPNSANGLTVTVRSLEKDDTGHWGLARDASGAELPPVATVYSHQDEGAHEYSLGALTGNADDKATLVIGSLPGSHAPMLYAELPQDVQMQVKQ